MTLARLIGMIAGSATLPMISVRFGVFVFIIPLVVITANDALFQAVNTTVVMATSGPEQRGARSGLLNLSRYLGLTLAHA